MAPPRLRLAACCMRIGLAVILDAMNPRRLGCVRAVLTIALVSVPILPLQAYITFPVQTLGQLCDSTYITVVRVEAVNREKGILVYRKVRDLKGSYPRETLRHVFDLKNTPAHKGSGDVPIRPDAKDWRHALDWAEVGKTAVVFSLKYDPYGDFGHTYIDGCWYATMCPKRDWDLWYSIYADPALLTRWHAGSPAHLTTTISSTSPGRQRRDRAGGEDRHSRRPSHIRQRQASAASKSAFDLRDTNFSPTPWPGTPIRMLVVLQKGGRASGRRPASSPAGCASTASATWRSSRSRSMRRTICPASGSEARGRNRCPATWPIRRVCRLRSIFAARKRRTTAFDGFAGSRACGHLRSGGRKSPMRGLRRCGRCCRGVQDIEVRIYVLRLTSFAYREYLHRRTVVAAKPAIPCRSLIVYDRRDPWSRIRHVCDRTHAVSFDCECETVHPGVFVPFCALLGGIVVRMMLRQRSECRRNRRMNEAGLGRTIGTDRHPIRTAPTFLQGFLSVSSRFDRSQEYGIFPSSPHRRIERL